MTLRISYLNFIFLTCIFIKCCLILIPWTYASVSRGLILIYIVVNKTGNGPVYIHQTNWMLDVAWEKSLDIAILRYCLLDKDLLVLFMDQFTLGSISDTWDVLLLFCLFSWQMNGPDLPFGQLELCIHLSLFCVQVSLDPKIFYLYILFFPASQWVVAFKLTSQFYWECNSES